MTHLKRPWCWEGLKVGGEGDDIGWDGWMASPTQWTWIWVNSGSWWWTGKPGVLWSIGSQRVWHDWATDLNWTRLQWPVTMNIIFFFFFFFAHTSRIGWVILLKWSKLSWFWVGSLTHQQSAGGSDGVWLVERCLLLPWLVSASYVFSASNRTALVLLAKMVFWESNSAYEFWRPGSEVSCCQIYYMLLISQSKLEGQSCFKY